jgi:ankyrin repeat protein
VLQDGWTALMHTASNATAAELVRLGADIYVTSIRGFTACEFAASKGHHEIADMLARAKEHYRATMVSYLAEVLSVCWIPELVVDFAGM